MKHLIATLAAASFSAHADDWTGPDKTKHATAGALIAASVGAATNNHTGFAVGVAAGLTKEVMDYRSRRRGGEHDPSYKDFAVTALGAGLGAYAPGIILTRRSISYQWSF